jgi:hypothetical protein
MDYEKQTVAQLKELCAQRGLSTPNKAKKVQTFTVAKRFPFLMYQQADYIEILKNSPAAFASDDVIPPPPLPLTPSTPLVP